MTEQRSLLEQVRRRLPNYLEPCVGAVAGMDLGACQQTIAGTFVPTHDQTQRLARRMGISFVWTTGKAA
jgi:hypothetical protein